MASEYKVLLAEATIREFPKNYGWPNKTYGLNNLDFEDFVPELAFAIVEALDD